MRKFRQRPRIVNGHPIVNFLFTQLWKQKMCEHDLAERIGLSRDTLRGWRTRYNPKITDLDAALRPLGYQLKVARIKDNE